MQQLLQDAESGQFDAVVVWKISRVARNLMNLLEIVNVLQKQDIAFYSISEKFQVDTTTGRFMLQIMASVNELERNQIAENVKLGMTKRAFDGGWNGGLILGYDNVEDAAGKKVLRINPEEAALIRLIFQEASTGKGYRAIANNLNRTGYKTKQGNPFESITLFWSPWGSKDSGCSKIKIAKVKACCYSTFTLAIYCFMDFATNVKKKKKKRPILLK